jgi:hypothetical protein
MDFELVVPRNDLRLEVYVDPVMYLALRQRCGEVDRSISQHVRHLIRADLQTASLDAHAQDRGRGDETPGDMG